MSIVIIAIAYAVLSDPNKRRQYDLYGAKSCGMDFEGLDISELGGVGMSFLCNICSKITILGKFFGAMFNKLGVRKFAF